MKSTLKLSSKLFFTVLLVAVLSFFVVITVGMDSPELVVVDADDNPIEYNETAVSLTGNICATATTFFLCVMIYHYSWNQGFVDYNRKYSETTTRYTFKGFVSGLFAVIPILIIGALALNEVNIFLVYVYKILVAPFIHWYNIMQLNGNYIFCQFIYLIVPLISGISYLMGKFNFMPIRRLMYGKKSEYAVPEKATSAMDIMNEKNRDNLK